MQARAAGPWSILPQRRAYDEDAMRPFLLLLVLILLTPGPPARSQPPEIVRAPDHVMMWTTDRAAADALLGRLGFTLQDAGSYEDFVASRTITFADQTFLELFHIYDRSKAFSPQARTELAFFDEGSGANSFALQVTSAAAVQANLRKAGFDVDEVQADSVDPDGPTGPLPVQPASWRDFHFRRSPVQGAELFFIEYAPEPARTAEQQARFLARTTHANGARRLTTVWLLVDDPQADAAAYRRMGLTVRAAEPVAFLGVDGVTVEVGTGRIVLVGPAEPPGLSLPARRRGPRILGLGIEVTDLATAAEAVQAAYPNAKATKSPAGVTLIAPTEPDLGLFLAFQPATSP